MPTRRSLLATLSAVGLAGCSLSTSDGATTPTSRETTATPTLAAPTPPPGSEYRYTHPQPTGNRTLTGSGAVRESDAVTFEPLGRPQWLVAHPADTGTHWTVVTADGSATRWHVRDGGADRVAEYDPLGQDTQPVVATGGGDPRLLRPPADLGSHASPMVAPGAGERSKLLYVAADGGLVVAGDERTRFDLDCPPDARLAALGDGRYAVFADRTDRYTHGALGDTLEGTSLVVVDPADPAVDWRATVGPPDVFEGTQPLVADLDGDGEPEVVTTVADSTNGARIAVFGTGGERLATGPVHEPGWRHQLAVAPFGPDGRPELAVVRKPHVDHLLEFYRLESGSLEITATERGFSTHTYGSRILSGALAGDLDGDGRVEALVPTTGREELAAVRRSADGAGVAWRKTLDGPVTSNVTGVATSDGLAVGAATAERVLVWQGYTENRSRTAASSPGTSASACSAKASWRRS